MKNPILLKKLEKFKKQCKAEIIEGASLISIKGGTDGCIKCKPNSCNPQNISKLEEL